MNRPDTRLTVERRHDDGEWEEVGSAFIDSWECQQVALILSGVDLGAFAIMSAGGIPAWRRSPHHLLMIAPR